MGDRSPVTCMRMATKVCIARRRFLQLASVGTVGALLVACGSEAPSPEPEAAKTIEPTAAPAAASSISEAVLLIRDDIRSAYAAEVAIKAFNKNFFTKVSLEAPNAGADSMIQTAQAAGNLPWSGFAVMETPWLTQQYVTRGLIQPIDDLIKSSAIPNADKVLPAIIPTLLDSSKYEGKQYAIPGNVGSIALAWQAKVLDAVGVKEPPTTWDEIFATAKKIKEKHPKLTAFDSAFSPLCDLYAMIWGGQDNPFNADGLVDITGPVSIEALQWMQKMVKEGLMPATHTDAFGNWLKGNTAMILSYDVAGTLYEKAFGAGTGPTGTTIFREKGKPRAGVPFWMNAMVVLNGAKNPQGMTDFYLWWVGPDNKASGRQFAEVAAKPCYEYQYKDFIEGKPEQAWQLQGIDLIRKSVGFNVNQPTTLQFDPTRVQIEKAMNPADGVDAKAALEQALLDVKAAVSQSK